MAQIVQAIAITKLWRYFVVLGMVTYSIYGRAEIAYTYVDYSSLSLYSVDNKYLYQDIILEQPPKTGLDSALFIRGRLTGTEDLSFSTNPLVMQQYLAQLDYVYTTEDFINYHNRQNLYAMAATAKTPPEILKERQQSFNHANQVLNLFLQKYPDLAASIESVAGFGVFEASNLNLILYAGGWGGGMVFDKIKHTVIYVDIFRAGTGVGLGYVDDYVLIIFKKHFAIEQYFGTGGAGGDVGGSATAGIWSKALSFNPTIVTYHLYNYGADIQANWGATLYWSSPTLN